MSLSVKDIIQIADEVYPDGLVGQAAARRNVGDGLAKFVATELKETFESHHSDKEKLETAHQAMRNAINELVAVANAFSERLTVPEDKRLQTLLAAARQHGEDSEPEHEVGDLQQMLSWAWGMLTEENRSKLYDEAIENII